MVNNISGYWIGTLLEDFIIAQRERELLPSFSTTSPYATTAPSFRQPNPSNQGCPCYLPQLTVSWPTHPTAQNTNPISFFSSHLQKNITSQRFPITVSQSLYLVLRELVFCFYNMWPGPMLNPIHCKNTFVNLTNKSCRVLVTPGGADHVLKLILTASMQSISFTGLISSLDLFQCLLLILLQSDLIVTAQFLYCMLRLHVYAVSPQSDSQPPRSW